MESKKVLFTWEIGQGFGHVMPLLPIARELKERGHRVTFALRDVRAAGALLKAEGFTVLQAPTHPDQFFPANGPQPQTMADILTIFGFASNNHLKGMIAAWEGLFTVCCPDVVVASYAPLSLLCARGANIPTVLMALPFELPSPTHPSPSIRTGKTPENSVADDRVISAVNTAIGEKAVSTVHEIFRADKTFLMSYPEFDPLYPREQVDYCGSFFVYDVGIESKWPSQATKRIFAYLNSDLPNLDSLRRAIQDSTYSYSIVLRGADAALVSKWKSSNVCVSAEVVRLDWALSKCDAVLSYGGHGFASACLMTGKPMVFFVRDLEAYLTARQVQKLGAGVLPQSQTTAHVMNALAQVLQIPSYRLAAENFAKCKLSEKQPNPTKVVADAVVKVMFDQTVSQPISSSTC